jgi:flagellar motility protein MotE (MotC chaperone)
MIGKLRILPLVIVTAVLLFGIKLVDIRRNIVDLGVKPALAETKKEAAGKPVTALAEKNQDGAAAGTRANGENSAEVDKQTTDTAAATDPTAPLPKAKKSISSGEHTGFTPAEIEVLENLTRRREELERRSQALAMREKLLAATEKSIDAKINELKKLEARISAMVKQHDKEAESQLKSLVKVYESMKPKDAARIFEQLDMDILLDVTARMREAKMAPVLAAMKSEKAKALTVQLATRRRLPETGG